MRLLCAAGSLLASTLGMNVAAQSYFPAPTVPTGNPITQSKALLGMTLFWEEQMSSSNMNACGSCHVFSSGGVDPRASLNVNPGPDGLFGTADDIRGARGVPARTANGRYSSSLFGIGAQVTPRKAPSVINAAYLPTLFYDGRAPSGSFHDPITNQVLLTGPVALENLIAAPPLNTIEMGHVGRSWADVAAKIAAARPLALATNVPARLALFIGNATTYGPLFQAAYGSPAVTPSGIIMAIATYMRTLVSDQTRYDNYLAGQTQALSAAEVRGMQAFTTPIGSIPACVQCHGDLAASSHSMGPGPSNTMYNSLPVPNSHNTGIRPIADDPGVQNTTANATDAGRFKAPGLRNVALHSTWFHNGEMHAVADVVAFYSRGGDYHVNQATEIQPRNLSAATQADIVAFLGSLTDARVQSELAPFDRPRLAGERAGYAPTVFGTGMIGSQGRAPVAAAIEPVFVGNPGATIAVQNTLPGTAALVMWDTDIVPLGFSYAGVNLYLGLYNFGLTYAGQTQSLPSGAGYASLSFAVPGNQALSGMQVYAQWLVVDPAGPVGAITSDAIAMVVR